MRKRSIWHAVIFCIFLTGASLGFRRCSRTTDMHSLLLSQGLVNPIVQGYAFGGRDYVCRKFVSVQRNGLVCCDLFDNCHVRN